MAPLPTTPRRAATIAAAPALSTSTPTPSLVPTRPRSTRPTSRPKSAGPPISETPKRKNPSSEPPRKRLRYIPGGPGGGGRYVDEDGTEIPVGGTGPGGYNYIGPRGRIGRENMAAGLTPVVYRRRDRSQRTRTVLPRSQQPPMRFQSAAQAAAVVQSDGYKPREERAWEEFHPDLDIDSPLMAFSADEIEGLLSRPVTPVAATLSANGSVNGTRTPDAPESSKAKSEGIITPAPSVDGDKPVHFFSIPGTPGGGKRRPGRPPKDPIAFFTQKAKEEALRLGIHKVAPVAGATPKPPKIIPPIQNTNPKEKLTLPAPSFRLTNTLARFEEKGYERYVDKSMEHVGYQTTDEFFRNDNQLIKVEVNMEDDLDLGPTYKSDGDAMVTIGSGGVGRVEYDMDEQDDKWLEEYNRTRKATSGIDQKITREIFEITITKIEKEWHALEKRIPKPNPKPPQTHRPRSSSAAAVNGEPQAGEEQDSKCAICDDGDCENTNAIVFCDGCDLAVHQECYGVPFIPEGQWMCRKCQLIGRGIPTCIFCPNTDGAFKQTNSSKWAHLLCAMWIPEVSLGNHTFMEPVMDVEKVPKTRWKLTCYLCNQRMGACIQCGNKNCYQAFHVTCARRAHLFLKMKNSHGQLAVLDGNTVLKAFCDKHCPPDYAKENDVANATRDARKFYKKTMQGRLWADSQASALAMAATHRHAVTEHQPDESQLTGAKVAQALGESKKKGNQPPKTIWKLPSGAPVIPKVVFDSVESSLQRFNVLKRKEYAADACRYWTLKREARRGAALLKRLQLQMETFSSMEITRRNFAGMGPAGRPRLERRIEFAKRILQELELLRDETKLVSEREEEKLKQALVDDDKIKKAYFPLVLPFVEIVDKLTKPDPKDLFTRSLTSLREKVNTLCYTSTGAFFKDLCAAFEEGINTEPKPPTSEINKISPSKKAVMDVKARKVIAKRRVKTIESLLKQVVQDEKDISGKSVDEPHKELKNLLEGKFEAEHNPSPAPSKEVASSADAAVDVEMDDANGKDDDDENSNTVSEQDPEAQDPESADVEMGDADKEDTCDAEMAVSYENAELNGGTVTTLALAEVNGNISPTKGTNGVKNQTPPDTNGYVSAPEVEQAGPPTPPGSNTDIGNDQGSRILTDGGIHPALLKGFHIDGTNISAIEGLSESNNSSSLREEASILDREVANEVGAAGPVAALINGSKSKKGKGKKRRR